MGVDHRVVLYIKEPPGREELETVISRLEDPVEDLVRKDSKFKKLGLDPAAFVGNPRAVIEILIKHKQLLQRPVLVSDQRAIIGRPKARIVEFLSGL